MAMNGNSLGKEIADHILDGKTMDSETKKTITEQWQYICDKILNHIKDNAEITVDKDIPVTSGDGKEIGRTSENGTGTIK